ncbi:MAG: cupredoxin domain-containing protein, partial [Acidimicrobiia bacterium]
GVHSQVIRMVQRAVGRFLRRELFAVLLLLVAGCGGTGPPPDSGHVTIEMLDNAFSLGQVRIPVGGEVTFIGAGRNPHNAVASDGSWSTETIFGSLQQMNGDTATLRFDQPGEYVYFCTLHGNAQGGGMAARLLIGDVNASAAA